MSIEVKKEITECSVQESGVDNEAISTQDNEKIYIKETVAIFNTDFDENQSFKAESPKILEHSNNEQSFIAEEEAEELDNPANCHHLNDNIGTGTTTATNYENTLKLPPNDKIDGQIQLHLEPDAHKCEICGKSISSEKKLAIHKRLIHGINQFKCDFCQKLFKQKFRLERHLLTHSTGSKDFICSECGKGFVAEQILMYHIKRIHNPKVFCNQCGKTIHGHYNYRRHLTEHMGGNKFPCDVCGLELKSTATLKHHKASYHNDGSTIFVCGVCGKAAPSRTALWHHKLQMHSEEARHKCTYCDKAFKYPRALREHVATHTGQDLYQCPHCPKTFQKAVDSYYHRKRIHPAEWEEGHKKRRGLPKLNISQAKQKVVI